MGLNQVLKEKNPTANVLYGNPYLDIFHDAYHKFGDYLDANNVERQLNLYHLTNIKENIKNYLKLLPLTNHKQNYYEVENYESLFQDLNSKSSPRRFIEMIRTRIPLQLCTLEDCNIIPLIKGRNEQNFAQQNIVERCKHLDFGIIEEILTKNEHKKIIVVGVMGAQSTGKSYLMNRLFGTRFTVASSRSTIGVWLSVKNSDEYLYLLMDCEGLFNPRREPKEEQKLIQIVSSLSNFVIMNLNMGLKSKSMD